MKKIDAIKYPLFYNYEWDRIRIVMPDGNVQMLTGSGQEDYTISVYSSATAKAAVRELSLEVGATHVFIGYL